MRQELIDHEIELSGNMIFVSYLDPVDLENIIVEGHGRYYLIRKKDNEILLSGDFDVVSDPYVLNDSKRADYIIANAEIYVTRIPNQITHIHKASLKYKIYLKTNFKTKGIFAIDYHRNHEVFMPSSISGNALDEKDKIAIMTFNSPDGDRKIIDTRGMNFLHKGYE